MSVLDTLSREHDVFRKLVDHLEASLAYDGDGIRNEVRDTLLVLFHALEKHEQIEDLVFGHPSYATKEGAHNILKGIEHQHKNITKIHADLDDALKGTGTYSDHTLRALVKELIGKLRLHFESEEKILWPHYKQAFQRSMDRSLDRRTRQRLQELERSVDLTWEAVHDYLGAKR